MSVNFKHPLTESEKQKKLKWKYCRIIHLIKNIIHLQFLERTYILTEMLMNYSILDLYSSKRTNMYVK